MWYHHQCSSWCGSSPFSSCTFPGDSFDHENQLLSHHTLAQAAKNWMSSSSKTWFPLRSRPHVPTLIGSIGVENSATYDNHLTLKHLLCLAFCFVRTGCWKYRTTCRGRASLLHLEHLLLAVLQNLSVFWPIFRFYSTPASLNDSRCIDICDMYEW